MSGSACIDDETIARMVADTLDPARRGRALAHLERCDECRHTVADAMQLADETRTIAGRYRLEGELGRGGMGMVYRAHDDVLDRMVAIKLLPTGTAGDGRARARLVRESKAMARLRHPNVVAIHDAGHDGDQFYVAMEHIPGTTLRGWLGERPRSVAEIVAMFVRAARGLAAAHAVGVVHRDFKPDNVLVDDGGEPKVADFGLARSEVDEASSEHDDDGEHDAAPNDGLTLSGPGAGTPAYMPPEQHGGVEVDRRADVFSLCVSLWEALYGVRPFVETSIDARLAAIRRGELVDAPTRRVDVRLRRVLQRGLAADPARRFASIEDLLAAIDAIEQRAGRRRRWLALSLGVLGIAAVGTALVLANRADRCVPATDRLDAVWTADAGARVQTAVFAHYEPVEAQVGWSRMRPAIEGVVAAYDRERVATCEARSEDVELATRRAACLRIERDAIAYRLELAVGGDVDAARGLDLGASASWCRELAHEWLAREPGHDAAIETGSAETRALVQLGRIEEARVRARETLELAERRGDTVLLARVRFDLGMLDSDPARATAMLQQAAVEAGEEHVTAALAWTYAGYYAERGDARRWLGAAETELAQVENGAVRALLQMRTAILEGEILIDEGDPDGALAAFEAALVIARDRTPATLPDILFLTTWAAWADGDLELALARQLELVRWHERAFTPQRQIHARALWNLADLQLETGALDDALASILRSHEVAGVADDADHHARRLLTEAEVRLHRGELVGADAVLDQAEALLLHVEIGSEDRGKLGALRASALLLREQVAPALELLTPQIGGEGSPVELGLDLTDTRALWGEAMRRAGRAAEALTVLEPELLRVRAAHPRLRETARIASVTGWLMHAIGRDADALVHFDDALALLVDPCERAWAEVGRVASGRGNLGALVDAAAVLEQHREAHRVELATIAALQRGD